jgi:hypothetical protein
MGGISRSVTSSFEGLSDIKVKICQTIRHGFESCQHDFLSKKKALTAGETAANVFLAMAVTPYWQVDE